MVRNIEGIIVVLIITIVLELRKPNMLPQNYRQNNDNQNDS